MLVTITKAKAFDHIDICRDDGSRAHSRFPKKGAVPHDAVHYLVEKAIGLKMGFWGLVASGHAPEDITDLAKQGGHASAKRAVVPQAHIVELLQAERIVECFEADLWGGGSDPATFRSVAQSACDSAHVAMPILSDEMISAIATDIAALQAQWLPASEGHMVSFAWPE